MRIAALGLALIGLAACDSGQVPPPSQQQELRAPSPSVEANAVELRGDGLSAGTEAFYFAAGKSEVEMALAKVLGEASNSGENLECGAGPMQYTDFPGGVTANFQDGSLVGWIWRMPQDGDAVSDIEISIPGEVQLGTSAAEAEAANGFDLIEDSTLDGEFSLGDKMGGFVEGEEVSMLYAGVQCFFR